MKEKFYVVYLEDSNNGKCIDWGDLVDSRLTWLFRNSDDAQDFASLLTCFLIKRFIPCVAECCSDDCTIYKVV